MKTGYSIFSFILIIIVCFSGACSTISESKIKTTLDRDFRLGVGETAIIEQEELEIKFDSVSADSRCAEGVTCVWAGEARCQMIITLHNNKSPLILIVTGSQQSETVYKGYSIFCVLQPYPKAGMKIDKGEYTLILKITKL
jgi:hypothetical protein